ncbi:hypothetical protein CDAR_168931 [Caerostris darwini]|uniref:Uncharacterized protein n=1 Tax=Caerostris darwini TaxID=1538125 RepID=A0AAV4WRK0_9ARAC|nr:hypothetical protein CDAR_168931 [Caerostris darwini]
MESPSRKPLSKVMEVDFVAVSKSKRLICRQLTCGWIGVLMDCKSKRSTNRKNRRSEWSGMRRWVRGWARYRKDDAVLQRSTEHEQPLAKQGTFAKARKRRRMRLIKTDRRQKGMAVVFLDDRRQQNTEPPREREVLPRLSSR